MIRCTLILLLGLSALSYGKAVYSIAASIGNYAITSYDIKLMSDFDKENTGKLNNDTNFAFKELISIYSLFYLSDNNKKIILQPQELENIINSVTNITNSKDPGVEIRRKLFQDFPDQYRAQIKKQQIVRAMMYYDQEVKEKVNADIPENDSREYYTKNSNAMIDPAMIDIIVIAAVQPTNLSLNNLEKFENTFTEISTLLKSTNDIDSILLKYKNVKFESYSGRTGLKSVYDLYYMGYPEEVIGISTMEKIQLNTLSSITMTNGVVFGPQVVPLKKNGKNTILIIKLIDRQPPKTISFEKARPLIENKLKDDRIQEIFHKLIIEKITKGEIPVKIQDNNYKGAYDEFIRG